MASTINVLTTGVGGIQQTGDTSGILQMQTNGTATLTIDTSGNLGVGVVPSAWGVKACQAGAGAIASGTGTGVGVTNNIYTTDGFATYKYINNGYGNMYYMDGNHRLFNAASSTAGSPATITEVFRIGTAGEIGLGGANYGTSGQFLKSNGPGAAATWGTAGGGFSNMTVFTSPGTFTTPATVTQVKVTVVGGGAGGGIANPAQAGSGGGGGGGAAIYVGPVTASTPYAVTVGAGGTAATPPATGNSGGTSSFGSLASATGGAGGTAGGAQGGVGGAGGAGSVGTLQFTGGGGGASSPGGGQNGGGGPAYFGGGGQAVTGSGAPGKSYGGGGSGGNSPTTGTTGAAGVVIVEY